MARIDIKSSSTGGGGGSGTVTSVAVSSTTLTVTGSPITSSGTITANIPDGYLKVGTGVTGSLQNVVDTNGTATQLFLSTTGIQATSKIQITTAETSYIDAEDNSGNNRFTVGRDPSSQLVTVDFASLPTALTTPVGAIRTATDGVTLANVMTFLENGNIGLNTDTPGSKFDVHSAGAIVAQFNKTVSGNSYIQQLTAGAGKWKHGFTSSTGAFDIIDDVNALTRLSLLNTGQLKLNAYTSTSAFTGTTAGFLAFDASGNILSVAAPAASPAGTTGAVQFNNAGAFGADSTNFFWDDTNNRLGIGTATPTVALDIKGDASFGNSQLYKISDNGSGNFVLGGNTVNTYYDATTFRVRNGANTPLYAEATRVGIGTTSPTAKLQVIGNGATSATTSLLVQNSAGANTVVVRDDTSVGFIAIRQLTMTTNGGADANEGLRFLAQNSGSTYIDGYSDGAGKGSNYPLFIGSRVNNLGSGLTGSTTQENGTQVIFGSAVSAASAVVQVNSTTRGFLPPRMTTVQKNAIATPAAGLMVYDSTLNKLCVYTTAWETITSI